MKRTFQFSFLVILACWVCGFAQTSYNISKYKTAFYSSTVEKTHATFAAFDSGVVKINFTATGKPEVLIYSITGTNVAYIDSAGAVKIGIGNGGITRVDTIKTAGGVVRCLKITVNGVAFYAAADSTKI